eukprot:jgi/Mesvir1/27395/Mv07198-RA.1
MVGKRVLNPAPVFDEPALVQFLLDNGIKPVHASAIWRQLLLRENQQRDHPDASPSAREFSLETLAELVPTLPKQVPSLLSRSFAALTSRVVEENHSVDNATTKLLIELQDGMRVESVIMRYDTTLGRESGGTQRATLCVSSQVGCKMACSFCATGTLGMKGQLSAGEILEQLVHANRVTPIRNVVFMGMGEPLNNYDAVICAVKAMTDVSRFGLAPSRVTISTVGVVPRILTLTRDAPGVNLALSLHAAEQGLRAQIMPAAKAYPLPKLMDAIRTYMAESGRKVFIQYILLADVNDTDECAHNLGALLRGWGLTVNLIPFNPTAAVADGFHYEAPSEERLQAFHRVLRQDYGLAATVRREMGQDISGACGQLALDKMDTRVFRRQGTRRGSRTHNQGEKQG